MNLCYNLFEGIIPLRSGNYGTNYRINGGNSYG
jgi:hypothetical protein